MGPVYFRTRFTEGTTDYSGTASDEGTTDVQWNNTTPTTHTYSEPEVEYEDQGLLTFMRLTKYCFADRGKYFRNESNNTMRRRRGSRIRSTFTLPRKHNRNHRPKRGSAARGH